MITALSARETHTIPTEHLGDRTTHHASQPEKVTA